MTMQPTVLGHDAEGNPITGYTLDQLRTALTDQRHEAAAAIDALYVQHTKATAWGGLISATKSACKQAVLNLAIG